MKPTVKLRDVAEHIEMASDDTYTFFNALYDNCGEDEVLALALNGQTLDYME